MATEVETIGAPVLGAFYSVAEPRGTADRLGQVVAQVQHAVCGTVPR